MGKENFANIILESMTTVRTAAVRAAVVTFVMLMMTANIVGVIHEIVSEQSFDRFVGVARGSAVELYAGLNFIDLKLSGVAEVLKNVSVFICYCYTHL